MTLREILTNIYGKSIYNLDLGELALNEFSISNIEIKDKDKSRIEAFWLKQIYSGNFSCYGHIAIYMDAQAIAIAEIDNEGDLDDLSFLSKSGYMQLRDYLISCIKIANVDDPVNDLEELGQGFQVSSAEEVFGTDVLYKGSPAKIESYNDDTINIRVFGEKKCIAVTVMDILIPWGNG